MTEFGGPEVLGVVDLPDSEAGPGELRIRVRAATVNPTDAGLRSGRRAALDQIGPHTSTDLQAGDHVMAIVVPSGSHGGYSEFVVVPAESVARVPAGASDAEASTLPMNGLTTRQALDLLELQPGQTLAITGAAGAVGGYAVQLGRADGLRVIADASASDEQLVKDLGADIVVRRGDDFADRVREVVPEGADGVIDTALLDELVLGAVRDGGGIATVRGYQGSEKRGVTWHPVSVRAYMREHGKLDRLRQQVESGQVTLRVARVFPAAQAAEAHRILQAGGTRGRLILEF